MKLFQWLFICLMMSTGLLAQKMIVQYDLTKIEQLYNQQQFDLALVNCQQFILQLDTLQDRKTKTCISILSGAFFGASLRK